MTTLLESPGTDTSKRSSGASDQRAKRLTALNFARGSVRLEGFILSAEAEAIHARYVNGEISAADRVQEIIRLHKK